MVTVGKRPLIGTAGAFSARREQLSCHLVVRRLLDQKCLQKPGSSQRRHSGAIRLTTAVVRRHPGRSVATRPSLSQRTESRTSLSVHRPSDGSIFDICCQRLAVRSEPGPAPLVPRLQRRPGGCPGVVGSPGRPGAESRRRESCRLVAPRGFAVEAWALLGEHELAGSSSEDSNGCSVRFDC